MKPVHRVLLANYRLEPHNSGVWAQLQFLNDGRNTKFKYVAFLNQCFALFVEEHDICELVFNEIKVGRRYHLSFWDHHLDRFLEYRVFRRFSIFENKVESWSDPRLYNPNYRVVEALQVVAFGVSPKVIIFKHSHKSQSMHLCEVYLLAL